MGRVARFVVLVVLLLSVASCGGASSKNAAPAATTTTAAQAAPEDRMVDVGGHELHLVCQGSGAPTVLVEMGAGQIIASWNETVPELAATHRTCIYERAGAGTSPAGPMPRTAKQVSDELQALVSAAKIPTPLIIVSHSIGGAYAQLFAAEHKDEVAGLVFVDPRTAEYQLGYREHLTPDELQADAADLATLKDESFGPEILAFDESAQQVVAAGKVADVPVVVLTAGVPSQAGDDLTFWRLTQQHLAEQVTDGEARIVDGAEHEIWRTHSSAVVDAVTEVAGKT